MANSNQYSFLFPYAESCLASQGKHVYILNESEHFECQSIGFLAFSAQVDIVSLIAIFKAKYTEKFMSLLCTIYKLTVDTDNYCHFINDEISLRVTLG